MAGPGGSSTSPVIHSTQRKRLLEGDSLVHWGFLCLSNLGSIGSLIQTWVPYLVPLTIHFEDPVHTLNREWGI